MAKFKFSNFQKGWFFKNPHLVGLDGFNDVNNFILYQHGIEKVKGWKRLNLTPIGSVVDDFSLQVIDDVTTIIDEM
jgi:hypothetical protein